MPAMAVLLPSLSGWCMAHIVLHLPAPLSVMWLVGLLWLDGRGGNAGMDVRREEVRERGGVRGSEASNVGCKPYTKRSEWGLHNQLNTLGPHSYTANRISAANRAPYDFSYWLTSYKSPNSALFHSKYSKFYTDYALLCVSCEIKPIKSNDCFS